MTVNAQDIELLEMYLDHELDDAEARSLDERLSSDDALQKALDRLRNHRSLRSAAMSQSFDSDAASIERLVASVRAARATETLALRRKSFSPVRSVFAAAACVAFGLLLGVAIQRQQAPNGLIASPGVNSTSSLLGTPTSFNAHGAYVVSLMSDGREVMKVHFPSPDHARQFMESINTQKANGRTPILGDATILKEEPY
jgi:anti-sigma-K factor RskA